MSLWMRSSRWTAHASHLHEPRATVELWRMVLRVSMLCSHRRAGSVALDCLSRSASRVGAISGSAMMSAVSDYYFHMMEIGDMRPCAAAPIPKGRIDRLSRTKERRSYALLKEPDELPPVCGSRNPAGLTTNGAHGVTRPTHRRSFRRLSLELGISSSTARFHEARGRGRG